MEDGRWSSLVLLYDPAQDKKYTVDSKVLASKYGWFLFAKRENDEEEYPYMTNAALFLYTPFTNRIIHLPNFILKLDDKATFSMPPDSPDCEIR